MLKYQELISGLKRGTILPLYLLYGEEEFLIQEALDLITATAVDPGARDFNLTVLYCRETPAPELVAQAQTLPLFAERRLVIAKDIDVYKAADLEQLLSYLGSPSLSTCLVMVSHQRKYDKKAVVSAVEAKGAVTVFYPLLDRDVMAWIEARAAAQGLTLRRDAAQYLWQTIGNDLQKLRSELEKTAIYLKERKDITLQDVRTVVGDFREYTPFDLADALGRKDREHAFLILTRLLQEGEQPVGLLGSIAWNFRRLLRAKALEAAGSGYDEIKRKLNVIFHQSARFQQQMRSYSLSELRAAFGVLVSADRELKSSGLSGGLVLERMILRLCGA